jgi:bifunctional non-homologous end joining protein LigD
LEGAKKRPLPRRIEVQLATLTNDAPEGDEWLYEIKFDGYRMVCRIDGGRVAFLSRNHKDWTSRLPSVASAAKELPVTQAVLDGEVVALRADGTTDFEELQNAFRDGKEASLYYYAFDLLYAERHDLTGVPIEKRKEILAKLFANPPRQLHLSEHLEVTGREVLEQACMLGLEGVIAKRKGRPYQPGRGVDWLKVKCGQAGEFVIGGYTAPSGSRQGLGALLVGYHDPDGALKYAGKVGTGFDARTLRQLLQRLTPMARDASPFADLKRGAGKTYWVDPTLVAQVAFGAWTRDRRLRHPSFRGLREDKAAAEITLERAEPIEKVTRQSAKNAARRTRTARKPPPLSPAEPVAANSYDARTEQLAGVRLTSPEKVLYPEQGITKLELANYYRTVADWIMPHIEDRLLVFVRCPVGRGKECFYQKHPAVGTPDAFRLVPVKESKKTEDYVVGLISIAQIGALEAHAWGSRADKLEQPDRLVFDLDPDAAVPWSRVVESARQLRQFLEDLGLQSFLKTTGGKGLHLVVPIQRRFGWDEVKAFCKGVADAVVSADPENYTANMAKSARHGKIFLDYLRNGRGATAVAPYSTRARPGAPISVPIAWEELSPHLTSDHFTIRNIGKRLSALKQDPWEGIAALRQGLAKAMGRLRKISS